MLSGRGLPGPVVTLCVHGQGSSPCPAAARMGLWLLLAIPSFWGSSSQGAVQPSPASGGPALRALCSRPQLLGIQLSGRCAAVPSFWGSSSQGAVPPSPPSGRPALGCSRPQLLGVQLSGLCAARRGRWWCRTVLAWGSRVTSGVRLLLLHCWWSVGHGGVLAQGLCPFPCLRHWIVCFSWKFSDNVALKQCQQ